MVAKQWPPPVEPMDIPLLNLGSFLCNEIRVKWQKPAKKLTQHLCSPHQANPEGQDSPHHTKPTGQPTKRWKSNKEMGKSRSPHTTPSQGDKIQATKCNNTLSGTQTAVIKPYVFHSEHTKMKQNQIRTSPKAVAPTPNKANRTRFRPHNADRNAHRGCKNNGIYNRFAFAIKTLCLLVAGGHTRVWRSNLSTIP